MHIKTSDVTGLGVTRCGNWWCHPIFRPKIDDRHHSYPLRLPIIRFSSILCKFSRQKFYAFIRVSPLDSVTRGGPLLPLVTPLIKAKTISWHFYTDILLKLHQRGAVAT